MDASQSKNTYVSAHARRSKLRIATITGLGLLLLFAIFFSLAIGRFTVAPGAVFHILFGSLFDPGQSVITEIDQSVVLGVRLPRILCAALVGAALSLSGAVYQGVFHNPLVSPDLLGVSSGACVGASLAILAHLGAALTQTCALIGGLAAVLLSMTIARLFRHNSPITLILSGIIVSALCSSLISLTQYTANVYEQLQKIVFWIMGSFATTSKTDVLAIFPVIVFFGAVLIAMRWRINLLSLGGKEARMLGVNLRLTRGLAILCATVITASSVSICGSVAWVGLIVPHLSRMLVGSDNRYVLPVSALFGGIFLVLADTLARTISAGEIPIGIITGLTGTILFVVVLIKQRVHLG